ncbi:cytochrome P450 6B2-like [Leguminivora glycinivorella]|uniref:cytochrome P450 6B2-like n=1 Tax=Leguminivora glycinivorella TaxID=1035111 RepID=UPI0020100641|nr:cytochrome P450 6B2-like [Leguminivora glycinivorella]
MVLFIAVVVLLILIYYYGTRNYTYWSKRGIKHDRPIPYLGTAKRQLFFQTSHFEIFEEMYWKYPQEKYVGYYYGTTPLIILRDPELVRRFLATDFSHFYSRSMFPLHGKPEPIMNNLFSCEGNLWRFLRQKMTHAFSSAKLRAMYPLIISRTDKLRQLATEASLKGTEVDVLELMARYTTDFIGSCGFGLDPEALNDENSMFRRVGHRIFHTTTRDAVVMFCKIMMPGLFKNFHYFPEFVEKNMLELVQGIIAQRGHKSSGRNDFIDLLLEAKERGDSSGYTSFETNLSETPRLEDLELTEELMAAQVFVFFGAGFETSSNSSSYMLHELAHHPEYQKKCQEEIDEVLARYDNKLCYDAINEMKFLAMCYSETLRIFPAAGLLIRKCDKPYVIPGTDIPLDPGVKVVVPVRALHRDPLYWEDPDEFRPDRFHTDNMAKINNNIYLPYGDGPRRCIGERLGIMQSLAGLAAVLSEFSVAPGKSTVRHPPLDPSVFLVQSVIGGLPLILHPRKKNL